MLTPVFLYKYYHLWMAWLHFFAWWSWQICNNNINTWPIFTCYWFFHWHFWHHGVFTLLMKFWFAPNLQTTLLFTRCMLTLACLPTQQRLCFSLFFFPSPLWDFSHEVHFSSSSSWQSPSQNINTWTWRTAMGDCCCSQALRKKIHFLIPKVSK